MRLGISARSDTYPTYYFPKPVMISDIQINYKYSVEDTMHFLCKEFPYCFKALGWFLIH